MTSVQNTLADELDKGTLFDEQCKHILADPQMLSYIIKHGVEECHDTGMDDLIEYFKIHPAQTGKEDTSVSGAKIIYDIYTLIDGSLCHTKNNLGLIISIEPQKKGYPGYSLPKRTIYNNSRMISGQKNVTFEKSNFDDLEKVYSIWIIYDHAKIDNGVMGKIKYEYTETGRNYDNISQAQLNLIKKKIEKMKEDADLSNIILVYPNTTYHDNDPSLNNFFSLLFDTNITPQQKKLLFEDNHGIMMNEKITLEVGSMCNMSGFMKKQGKLEDARNIMETLSLTLEQAMDALKISEEDRPWFIDYLSDDED